MSLHQIAHPFRFNFRVTNSVEDSLERLRKGKQVVLDDGQEGRVIAEIGETSRNGEEERIDILNNQIGFSMSNVAQITGEQRIDIAVLTAKDAESLKKAEDQKKKTEAVYREALLSSRNIVGLVVIFLATVGCTVGLNPPGGINDDGEAAAGAKKAFTIFMLGVYSMMLACLVTLGLLCGVTPRNQRVQRKTLRLCHATMWIGLLSFAVVFVSGCWLIVPSNKIRLKLTGLFTTAAGLATLFSYIWCRKARKFLRSISFCDLDNSSDEDEEATPMVTS